MISRIEEIRRVKSVDKRPVVVEGKTELWRWNELSDAEVLAWQVRTLELGEEPIDLFRLPGNAHSLCFEIMAKQRFMGAIGRISPPLFVVFCDFGPKVP